MKTKFKRAQLLWDIFYPVLMYNVILLIVMNIVRSIIGIEISEYMLCQIISTLIVLPIMYLGFYKKTAIIFQEQVEKNKFFGKKNLNQMLIILIVVLLLSLGLNNVLLMSPLNELSKGYAEANANFYGSVLVLEIIGSGIITPILEELVYRGIVYGRLRCVINTLPAILVSSFAFSLIHFNLVQFIYAFIMGIALAVFMEWCNSLIGAIAGHMIANIFAVIRTETGFLSFTVDGSATAWIISLIVMIGGILGVGYICIRIMPGSKDMTTLLVSDKKQV